MKNTKEKNPKTPHRVEAASLKTYGGILLVSLLASASIERGEGLEHFAGALLLTTILLGILFRDINRYKPAYVSKGRMLALLGVLIVLTMGASRLTWHSLMAFTRGMDLPEAVEAAMFGLPIPAGAMLVALLFDFHTAIVFAFVVSLFTGLWLSEPTLSVYYFVGSLTAAFSVIRCKRRTAIIMGGVWLLGAYVVTLLPVRLFTGEFFSIETAMGLGFSVVSAVSVVAIVSLTLPIFEYLFKITTDISLLELLDLDQPLMKNLMIQAPGTYHHSIIVGNLVESSADVIGVNPMLARVGAYYHDIGKVKMPEYFIENQPWGVSKHEKLTPHMSSMILTSHVKEGADLARQYKLPESVINIIQQHHGTALITYFYEKAKAQPSGKVLSEDDYRYQGPRPQTRVAALIMMADAVEAASRVLTDPTPSRIAALVDRIVNHIFLAGQLDDCELTFKDINIIKDRFTYILTGILHKRINYPGFDFGPDKESPHGDSQQQAKDDKARQRPPGEGVYEDSRPAPSRQG